jgi:DNA-3-methyladenine glycosylase I
MLQRCPWTSTNELMIKYHDTEWGVPLHNDNKLFEFLLLDAFQAGLSWQTIINKRENFRNAFDNFEPTLIAEYNETKYNELINNAGIIRNKLKVSSAITNARLFLELKNKYGTFSEFIWKFTNQKTIQNEFKAVTDVPAKSEISDQMSKELTKLGFKFVGSTICYAFMQATGIVNDHLTSCFRYEEVKNIK